MHVCARTRVCWYYFADLSSVSVCLPVHTVTETHKHTYTSNTKNTVTQAMKARQKRRLAGPTTGCCTKKETCIDEKQRVRQPAVRYTQEKKKKEKKKNIHTHPHKHACWYVCLYEERERIRVSQPAVRYTQKSKQTNIHTSVSEYVCVYEERERLSVTLVTTAAQGCASDVCMCSRARAVCVQALFR
jgi:hypothetical protein